MNATEERDRLKNPSINRPETREEAFEAIRQFFVNALTSPHQSLMPGSFTRAYTTDMGFGMKRTQEQADWLNEAQDTYRARLLFALED